MPFPRSNFTGFPFDRDSNRSNEKFRSRLDDLARRHPEFAEHFEGFPFSSDPFQRSDEDEYFTRLRNRERPFGSRFASFETPFEDDFQRGPSQEQEHQHQNQQQQQQSSRTEAPAEQQTNQEPTASGNQAGENTRKQSNIQQSSTVDLGQKQEPVNDRSQRAMSAPPSGSTGTSQTRPLNFASIPVQRETAGQSMPHAGSQTAQSIPVQRDSQSKQGFKPTERIIPIHVEGRDEPVFNKNVHHPSMNAPPHQFSQHEPDHTFGMGPDMNFMGRSHPSMFRQQQQQPPQPQPQPQPQPPKQREVPLQRPAQSNSRSASPRPQPSQQHQQQQQQPHQQTPPPQPQQAPAAQPPKLTQLELIQAIRKDVNELKAQIDGFSGVKKDKRYLFLDEMLTRNLIKLDNIDSQGQDNVRLARKETIVFIEKCISDLEAKANENTAAANNQVQMETEASKDASNDKMEVSESSVEQTKENNTSDQTNVNVADAKISDGSAESCESNREAAGELASNASGTEQQQPVEDQGKSVIVAKDSPAKPNESQAVEGAVSDEAVQDKK